MNTINSTKQSKCGLCPRGCLRSGDGGGVCFTESDAAKVSHIMLHRYEEPFLCDAHGSGTVFFSGCNLRCVYCQNHLISRNAAAFERLDYAALADAFLSLQARGACNINLVTPTHFSHIIIKAVEKARKDGLALPVVYNTGGYELPDVISRLSGVVDIYLTDFKYHDNLYAKKYSHCSDYLEFATAALAAMLAQTGAPRFGENGLMTSGTVVRHLALPGMLADSRRVLSHVFSLCGNDVFYSIMNQYTPTDALDRAAYPELCRSVPKKQYSALIDYALSLGITNALIQHGGTVSESFIPDFNADTVKGGFARGFAGLPPRALP